ncbi:hypothetical protein BDV34DRAFT_122568 [Aspergillus parasiticus]|uniref:Uncharacterized protein n=1 Tax=Aspergillus parasiticus TaxID=5067 RepID=A0A5N6DHR9_ASPPA|nr:hypothetical protein BDV34DRAFT_122568 [Aspergillus parasiticus]
MLTRTAGTFWQPLHGENGDQRNRGSSLTLSEPLGITTSFLSGKDLHPVATVLKYHPWHVESITHWYRSMAVSRRILPRHDGCPWWWTAVYTCPYSRTTL